MQINRWIYSSSSPWGIPLCCNLFWKTIDSKNFLFIRNKQLNCISCLIVYKNFFCSELPDILDKAWQKNKKKNTGNCKALCISHKSNNLVGPYIVGTPHPHPLIRGGVRPSKNWVTCGGWGGRGGPKIFARKGG